MTTEAIVVDHVSKAYRIYQERNQDLKRRVLRGRRARYEQFWAVQDVSLSVAQGEVFGIIGSNGSGKSTTLKLLAKILVPDAGSIQINGSLAALLELGAGFHPELTGRENVYLNGALLGIPRRTLDRKIDEIIDFAGLGVFIDNPIKTYSSGMYVRLGFSVAINVDPDILLIDEVLAVGDEEFQRRCLERIQSMRAAGKTIVIVSHGLGMVRSLCQRAAWIDHGVLRGIGLADDIVDGYQGHADPDVAEIAGHVHTGSGEVRVARATVSPNDGARVVAGGCCTFSFELESSIEDVDLVFAFSVRRADGLEVSSQDSSRSTTITSRGGRFKVKYEVPALPLLAGEYDVLTRITSRAGMHVYDEDVRAIQFDVAHAPDRAESGVASLLGEWSTQARGVT